MNKVNVPLTALIALVFSVVALQAANAQAEQIAYDVVINNGRVMDPLTGFDGMANVGITSGTIAVIVPGSQMLTGAKEIDAAGLIVAPGFINIHSHVTDLGSGGVELYIQDGITTEIAGNCGVFGPTGFAEFSDQAKKSGLYSNIAAFVGHNTLREYVGVPSARARATPTQLAKMKDMARQSMTAGAMGVSFGPFYGPGATFAEMLALAKVAAEYGGCASSHVRDSYSPSGAVTAVKEGIRTAREAGIPFLISHTGGSPTVAPRSSGPVLEAIHEGRAEGLRLAIDFHGYDAFLTELGAPIFDYPPNLLMCFMESSLSDFEVPTTVAVDGQVYMKAGERFATIAQFKYVRKKVKSGEIADPGLVGHLYKPPKLNYWMSNPSVMIENDCTMRIDPVTGAYAGHPKDAGAFAHFLGYWVREMGVCDMRTALARMSSMAAFWLGLDKKGRVQAGCDADIVIFDPDRVSDASTYTEPGKPSTGIPYVLVNGVLVVENSRVTGAKPGQVIRRTWTVPGEYPNLGKQAVLNVSALNE